MEKLEIKRPDWQSKVFYVRENGTGYSITGLDEWFDQHVEPINKILAEGVEVYAEQDEFTSTAWTLVRGQHPKPDTHKALLINIQPIQKLSDKDKYDKAVEALKMHSCMDVGECIQCRTLRELGELDD